MTVRLLARYYQPYDIVVKEDNDLCLFKINGFFLKYFFKNQHKTAK